MFKLNKKQKNLEECSMFNLDDTLYEIINKYPEALDFFIAN